MNKLSEEQINDLVEDYEISRNVIEKLEDILENCNFTEDEYYNIIVEIISEYQTFKLNKELQSSLANSYHNLKDIIVKVLKFKIKDSDGINLNYEKEARALILKLK